MASNSQPVYKKVKLDEQVVLEKDDDRDEKERSLPDYDEEEFEYSDVEDWDDPSLDEPIPEIGCDTSDEDVDKEEYKEYKRIIRESQGFDVPDRPPGVKIAPYGAVRAHNMQKLEELSRVALDWYNGKNDEKSEKYEFVKADHGSKTADFGFLYYITFIARAVGDNRDVTFRAKVLDGIEDIQVDSCEFAPVSR